MAQRRRCDHEVVNFVIVSDIKTQLHQFGLDPQQPGDHDPSHKRIEYIVCHRLLLGAQRGITRSGEPGKGIVSQGS